MGAHKGASPLFMPSIARTDPAWKFWDSIADAMNPALLIALFIATWLHSRKYESSGFFWRFIGRAVLAILVIYVVAHLPRWLHWNPFQSKFPSGHTAFAASCITSLWLLDARSKYLTVPLLILYAALIVVLGHHIWIDIFGALIVAPPIAFWCHRFGKAPTLRHV